MSQRLSSPPRVDLTSRAAQTSKKYMGNPFWVFAAFVKKIQGVNIAFLPFLPFFGLYFGLLVSIQNKGAWGFGANGVVFWVGYGLSIFLVYLVGNAFSGDKATEISFGDGFVPLLVLLPGMLLDSFWGSVVTGIVLGVVYLGAWLAMRDRREATYYVGAIAIFLIAVWFMAGLTAYLAKGFGSAGWDPRPVDIVKENRRLNDENTARIRQQYCQQGKLEYCGVQKPVFPGELLPRGMSPEQAGPLLAEYCRTKSLPPSLSGLGPVLGQIRGQVDAFCQQWQAYSAVAQTPVAAANESGMFRLATYYFATGKLPAGWENISTADMATVAAKAGEIRKHLCEKGPEPAGWSTLSQPEKEVMVAAAVEVCKKEPANIINPATPGANNQSPGAGQAKPSPMPTCPPGFDWGKYLNGGKGGCMSTK